MTGNLFQKMVGGVDRDLSIRRDGLTDLDSPKHGKMDPDNAPHVGGNTWAGGTGGRDTAGMGGIGGPYRLDAGHDVHQVSDEVKEQVPVAGGEESSGYEILVHKLWHSLGMLTWSISRRDLKAKVEMFRTGGGWQPNSFMLDEKRVD